MDDSVDFLTRLIDFAMNKALQKAAFVAGIDWLGIKIVFENVAARDKRWGKISR
jgi:hypothetical protein